MHYEHVTRRDEVYGVKAGAERVWCRDSPEAAAELRVIEELKTVVRRCAVEVPTAGMSQRKGLVGLRLL
ncbi:unnamed protein product [Lampetra planeri]